MRSLDIFTYNNDLGGDSTTAEAFVKLDGYNFCYQVEKDDYIPDADFIPLIWKQHDDGPDKGHGRDDEINDGDVSKKAKKGNSASVNPPPNSSSSTPVPMLTASLAVPLSHHTIGPLNMLGEIVAGYTSPSLLPAPPRVSVNLGTPLHQPLLQNELPLLRTPRVAAVESPRMEVHACMGATIAACVCTDTCMDASANKNWPVGLQGSVQPTLQGAAVAELDSSTTTGDGRPVQPMTAQAKVLQSPA